jgi:amicyanin
MTVKAGAVVTWTNRDDIPHNVVSTEKKFSSPVLDTDQAFSFRFQEPGAYPYFCKIHPTMTGTIIVAKDTSGNRIGQSAAPGINTYSQTGSGTAHSSRN